MYVRSIKVRAIRFQSTLPRGERHVWNGAKEFLTDFNPRSREGSDDYLGFPNSPRTISIHAPARGATEYLRSSNGLSDDFNPRSREGLQIDDDGYTTSNFNPRSREGSDS